MSRDGARSRGNRLPTDTYKHIYRDAGRLGAAAENGTCSRTHTCSSVCVSACEFWQERLISRRGCLQGAPRAGPAGPAMLLGPRLAGSPHLGNALPQMVGFPHLPGSFPVPCSITCPVPPPPGSTCPHLLSSLCSRLPLPPALASEHLRSQDTFELLTKPMAPTLGSTQPADTNVTPALYRIPQAPRTLPHGAAGLSGLPGPGRAGAEPAQSHVSGVGCRPSAAPPPLPHLHLPLQSSGWAPGGAEAPRFQPTASPPASPKSQGDRPSEKGGAVPPSV